MVHQESPHPGDTHSLDESLASATKRTTAARVAGLDYTGWGTASQRQPKRPTSWSISSANMSTRSSSRRGARDDLGGDVHFPGEGHREYLTTLSSNCSASDTRRSTCEAGADTPGARGRLHREGAGAVRGVRLSHTEFSYMIHTSGFLAKPVDDGCTGARAAGDACAVRASIRELRRRVGLFGAAVEQSAGSRRRTPC